jgi:NAD+ dependent glucose-6-phosphate dehydrogenase
MNAARTILITGASGNLGSKLRQHLHGRYPLRLVDMHAKGDPEILQADLSLWDATWVEAFHGVHTVVHLAADPGATQPWEKLMAPNLDALIMVFTAAVQAGVKRLIYASSNHAMGGYREVPEVAKITVDLPPLPGTRYEHNGAPLNSIAYGAAKLFGERLGKCYADMYGLSVIAVRIGWVQVGDNRPTTLPADRDTWFRQMWLSNRDFCHLLERCIEADAALRFAVVNGMSANTGMRWDIEPTRTLLGYEPQDDVTR